MADISASAPLAMPSARRLMGRLHLWFGLICGIPAAVLGVTGIVLMLTHPLPATVTQDRVSGSIDALIARAQSAAPSGTTVQQYTAPITSGEPAVVRFGGKGRPLQIEVDPTSGETHIVEQAAWRGGVHDLHEDFAVGPTGRWLVGVAGALMAAMALTGLVIWWPRPGQWRHAFTVSGRGGVMRVLRELHGAAGIWGLIVFSIVSVTGVVLAFPNQAGRPPGTREGRGTQGAALYQVDAVIALAHGAVPDAIIRSLTLPRRAGDAYEVRLAAIGDDRFSPPTAVTVDATATQVLEVRQPQPASETLSSVSRRLHAGRGGWLWWSLVLISGTLPVGFAISGTSMWLLKRRRRAG